MSSRKRRTYPTSKRRPRSQQSKARCLTFWIRCKRRVWTSCCASQFVGHLWNPLAVLEECPRIVRSGELVCSISRHGVANGFSNTRRFGSVLVPKMRWTINKAYNDVKDFWPLLVRAGFLPSQMGRGPLPFNDQEFDIVFSNAVIEHVGSRESQRAFASEV